MYLNGYSVRVIGGQEIPGGYVEMSHDQRYKLQMRNSNAERCNASVEIDGRHVGTWRIPDHRTITLERPANDDGHFTFYRLGSHEGAQVQLVDNANLGLVKVTFTPEVKRRPIRREREVLTSGFPSAATPKGPSGTLESSTSYDATPRSFSLGQASAGGTGLSGHSGQRFWQAEQMDLDYSRQVVIHLRLVCKNGEDPRPLASHSTPVPPRVR
jgi:hypothetical protein